VAVSKVLFLFQIEDLETPYENYSIKYSCGFDEWSPVADNARLPNILNTLTTNFPPPNSDSGPWTLDSLFLLPKTRLKYYRKLYSRLLKSTSPGRNDHKLLAAAVEKLEFLLDTLDSRADIRVGESGRPSSTNPTPRPAEDEVVIDLRTQSVIAKTNNNLGPVPPPKRTSDFESESSSARGSSLSETYVPYIFSLEAGNLTFEPC
jgi:hypothetical protein